MLRAVQRDRISGVHCAITLFRHRLCLRHLAVTLDSIYICLKLQSCRVYSRNQPRTATGSYHPQELLLKHSQWNGKWSELIGTGRLRCFFCVHIFHWQPHEFPRWGVKKAAVGHCRQQQLFYVFTDWCICWLVFLHAQKKKQEAYQPCPSPRPVLRAQKEERLAVFSSWLEMFPSQYVFPSIKWPKARTIDRSHSRGTKQDRCCVATEAAKKVTPQHALTNFRGGAKLGSHFMMKKDVLGPNSEPDSFLQWERVTGHTYRRKTVCAIAPCFFGSTIVGGFGIQVLCLYWWNLSKYTA